MTKKDEKTPEVKTNLVWRMSGKITLDEVERMLEKELINKEEARELLFRLESEEVAEPATVNDLKKEMEFLRGLILQLMNQHSTTTTVYKYITSPQWTRFEWNKPYITTAQSLPNNTIMTLTSGSRVISTAGTTTGYVHTNIN